MTTIDKICASIEKAFNADNEFLKKYWPEFFRKIK